MKGNIYPIITPRVEILGQFDTVVEAWKVSRPHLSGDDLELHLVNDIDLPVHGMAVYSFKVTGSLAMRELCFMLRPQTGAWAVSNRTIDLKVEHLRISEETPIHNRRDTAEWMNTFLREKNDKKVSQDMCKNLLPYGMVTDFCFVCDKRTLANVIKGMKKGYPILYEFYGKQIEELVPELANTPGGDWLLNDMLINKADLEALENGPVKMGRMNIVGGKIQGVLLAQFIRKIYDKVYSDILLDIQDGSIYSKPQTAEYNAVIYMPDSSLKRMQSTRTCAFAMFDKEDNSSWSSVLQVDKLTTEQFKEQLPCNGCASKCAFQKEQLPRLIAGNNVEYDSVGEVNPPCAIQTGIKGTHKLRGLKFNSKSKIYNKWTEMLESMELELTDDGREYLKNVNRYGFAEAMDNNEDTKASYLKIVNEGNEEFVNSL